MFNQQKQSLNNQNKSLLISDYTELAINDNNQQDVLRLFKNIDSSASKKYKFIWYNNFHTPEFWYRLGIKDLYNHDLYQLSGEVEWRRKMKSNHTYFDSLTIIDNELITLNSNNPYTKAITVSNKFINEKYLIGNVLIKAQKGSAPIIVCVVKNKNQPEINSYFELRKYISQSNEFHFIPYYFDLDKVKSDLEYVKLFMMNNTKADVILKDSVF
jgi:hypothetical protein